MRIEIFISAKMLQPCANYEHGTVWALCCGGYARGNRGSRGTGRGRGGRGRAGKWVFQADEPSKVAVARKMSTKNRKASGLVIQAKAILWFLVRQFLNREFLKTIHFAPPKNSINLPKIKIVIEKMFDKIY